MEQNEDESRESEDDSSGSQHSNDSITVQSQSSSQMTQEPETPHSSFTQLNDASCRKEYMFYESDRHSLYYTSLTLTIRQKACYDGQPKCREWQVRVGQTIAVACRDTKTPPYMVENYTLQENLCYPFKTPWVPTQILALHRTKNGDHFSMSFQRLYWHH
jgi:hypothetical protein